MKRKQNSESSDIELSEPGNPGEHGTKEQKAKEQYNTEGAGKNRKGKGKKYVFAGIVLVVFVALAAGGAVFIRNGNYYQAHFLPNTTINGFDCSNLDIEAALALLDGQVNEYVLKVVGRDYRTGDSGTVIGEITSGDISLSYQGTRESLEDFLNRQDASKWLQAYFGEASSYQLDRGREFDERMLQDAVEEWDACKRENMLLPEDAYIGGYSDENKCYEIVPETKGTKLDVGKLVRLVSEAVTNAETMLDVEGEDCYVAASVRQDNKALTDTLDKVNSWLATSITYDWNGTEVILDCNTLKDWISIKDGEPVLDEEQVTQFVKTQAGLYDTYGKKRNFMTSLGVELTLPSGYYGWKTDRDTETKELIELIYEGSSTKREPVYSSTAMQKGTSDIGDSYVEVDITNQHVYLYIDGEVILETDCVTGNISRSCDTPAGVFCLAYKQKGAVLRGRDYETPVTYWMPFYGNYGMHDAYWRSKFGGNIYKTNGSRGCVNLPPSIAEEIFGYVYKGFPVICYYYEKNPIKNQGSGSTTETNTGNTAESGGAASTEQGGGASNPTDTAQPDGTTASDGTSAPNVPTTPDVPATPDAAQPGGTTAPDVPSVPNVPTSPDVPATPDAAQPGGTTAPDVPSVPNVPTSPDVPATAQPDVPAAPDAA